MAKEIFKLCAFFDDVSISCIPRSVNVEAHLIVNLLSSPVNGSRMYLSFYSMRWIFTFKKNNNAILLFTFSHNLSLIQFKIIQNF